MRLSSESEKRMSQDSVDFSVLQDVALGQWLEVSFHGSTDHCVGVLRSLEMHDVIVLDLHTSLVLGAVDDSGDWDWRGEDRRTQRLGTGPNWSSSQFERLRPWITSLALVN